MIYDLAQVTTILNELEKEGVICPTGEPSRWKENDVFFIIERYGALLELFVHFNEQVFTLAPVSNEYVDFNSMPSPSDGGIYSVRVKDLNLIIAYIRNQMDYLELVKHDIFSNLPINGLGINCAYFKPSFEDAVTFGPKIQ